MSYVVLARRYRPQGLEQIIGQEHIARTLKNAIAENRVAHAYLFSGPRGVGKTTMARILAKALNCKKGPTATPCGTCPNCTEIVSGAAVDVQEIDGASNRGIDEIRALRDNVKFAPASSKYKIYIIDEAHQITDAAFNALLKTLEEPPEHVVFILATTESQKIPITILSRCQRYRFRLLSAKEIMTQLQMIVKDQGFDIETDALQVITASAGGSMRDALSLLDQAVSFSSGRITAKDIQELLGFLPKELIGTTIEAVGRNDEARLLEIVREVSEQGYNLLQFARDFREHLRKLMLYKANPGILEVTAEELKILESQHGPFSNAWLVRAGHLLSRALDEMKWSEQPRLVLELYLLKLAQPYVGLAELVDRLERLEKNVPIEDDLPAARPAAPAPKETRSTEYTPKASKPVEFSEEPEAPAASPEPAPKAAAAPAGDVAAAWDATVAELSRVRPIIGSLLTGVALSGSSSGLLMLTCQNSFQLEGLKRNQALIEDILQKKAGRQYQLRAAIGDIPAAAAKGPVREVIEVTEEAAAPEAGAVYRVEGELTNDKSIPSGLEKIMDKFPGRITKKQKPS